MLDLAERSKEYAARSARAQERSARTGQEAAVALQTIAAGAEQHPDIFPKTLATVRRLRASGLWPLGQVSPEGQ